MRLLSRLQLGFTNRRTDVARRFHPNSCGTGSREEITEEKMHYQWQHYYNWYRIHGSLNGKTPMERYFELSIETPYLEDVSSQYDMSKERIQESNYRLDLELRRVKGSLWITHIIPCLEPFFNILPSFKWWDFCNHGVNFPKRIMGSSFLDVAEQLKYRRIFMSRSSGKAFRLWPHP